MNLKCMINGVEYVDVIAQGAVFAEEFNETLDSGSIILTHVEKIENLLPYDDVFIYENSEHWESGFYRHLLVNNFSYERINIAPFSDNKVYFTYKIELFSETKGLETIQLPNISITQPKNFGDKNTKTVYYYLHQFINMYSPKIKIKKLGEDNKWVYTNKYTLAQDNNLLITFSNVYAPSFSLNNPNLRDVLAQLMLTKDMIPYVKDGEIYGMDITKRGKDFYHHDVYGDAIKKEILNITGSRTSENHCDGLKRTYNNALSQENTCKTVEYIGFRNSDTALMTLENMRLETRFPIYKINKIYLCYYKKGKHSKNGGETITDHIFLCKHDISPLIKLNSERQLLSKDWIAFHEAYTPKTIDEMSKYQMATIGYDIGSRYITGWGEKYSYIKDDNTWYKFTNSYIQNIVEILHKINPLGIFSQLDMNNFLNGDEKDIFVVSSDDFFQSYVNPFEDSGIAGGISSGVLGLKGIFFEIEYEGFYNGTVIHSKDDAYENIIMSDNSSSSLTLLEKDGLFQKEKVNRFGNEAVIINARHENFEHLRPVGTVLNDKTIGLEDVIIYHREYSIYDNFILATYYGTKDYVLKNYFTTVFSKHRPYNLLPYEESVRRSENKKMYLLFSKDNLLYEDSNKIFDFDLSKVISFYKQNPLIENGTNYFSYPDKINYGYIEIGGGEYAKKYASDINVFVCGNSLCFNMAMYDNVSGGVYIQDKQPDADLIQIDVSKDFSGSVQDWYVTVDDVETGFLDEAGFYFSHKDNKSYFNDAVLPITNESYIKSTIYDRLFLLPKLENTDDEINKIGSDFTINKDNKELIDITYQIEPISKSNDVFFSPWMMKLSDLFSGYDKFNKMVVKEKVFDYSETFNAYCTTILGGEDEWVNDDSFLTVQHFNYGPFILLAIPKSSFNELYELQNIALSVSYNFELRPSLFPLTRKPKPASYEKDEFILNYSINFNMIKHISKNNDGTPYSIHLQGERYRKVGDDWNFEKCSYINEETKSDVLMEFRQLDVFYNDKLNNKLVFSDLFGGKDFYYFVNMRMGGYNHGGYREPNILMDCFSNNLFKYGWQAANPRFVPKDDTIFGKFYFINPTTITAEGNIQDINNYQRIDMYISKQVGSLTYHKNMFMAFGKGKKGKIEKHLIYNEYGRDENNNELLPDYLELSELRLDEYIKYVTDDGAPYLKITIPPSYRVANPADQIPENGAYKYSSFQVWYFHEDSYKFVFGVNLTSTDIDNGYVKIYVSAISNKDPRVYKSTRGILDGYVQNLLEPGAPRYGTGQYYKKIKKQ